MSNKDEGSAGILSSAAVSRVEDGTVAPQQVGDFGEWTSDVFPQGKLLVRGSPLSYEQALIYLDQACREERWADAERWTEIVRGMLLAHLNAQRATEESAM